MQVNKLNNIVFLKNIESNVIDEALVILKENVNLENKQIKENAKLDILKEAELIINQEVKKQKNEYDKFKLKKLEIKLKWLKFINIFIVVLAIIGILIDK